MNKPKIHPKLQKTVKYAFTLEDVDYYYFAESLDMPISRWYIAGIFQEEYERGISRQELANLMSEIKKKLNQGDLVSAAAIVNEIEYRNEHLYDVELLHKAASVVFFDLEEDLTTYDFAWNSEKIAAFKRCPPDSFFLQTPAKVLVPFPISSEQDIQTLFQVMKAMIDKSRKIVDSIRQN